MWQENDDRIMDILDNIEVKNKRQFPSVCPICGEKEGHIYFHRYKKDDDRGGMWVWCSACRHSAHTLFKIPKWWDNLKMIKFEKLANYPDYLEKNKRYIDKWVNKLLFNDNI